MASASPGRSIRAEDDFSFRSVTSLAVMQRFGRDRVESGHRADIFDRSKMDPKAMFGLRRPRPVRCQFLTRSTVVK